MRMLPDTRSEIDKPFRATMLTTESCSTGRSCGIASFQPVPKSMPCAALKPDTHLPSPGVLNPVYCISGRCAIADGERLTHYFRSAYPKTQQQARQQR